MKTFNPAFFATLFLVLLFFTGCGRSAQPLQDDNGVNFIDPPVSKVPTKTPEDAAKGLEDLYDTLKSGGDPLEGGTVTDAQMVDLAPQFAKAIAERLAESAKRLPPQDEEMKKQFLEIAQEAQKVTKAAEAADLLATTNFLKDCRDAIVPKRTVPPGATPEYAAWFRKNDKKRLQAADKSCLNRSNELKYLLSRIAPTILGAILPKLWELLFKQPFPLK